MTLHHCLSFFRHRFGHCLLCNAINPCPSSSGALSTRCKPVNLRISILQCLLMGLRSWLISNGSRCNAGGTCSIQDWEDPLDDGMATPSNILDYRIHGQRKLAYHRVSGLAFTEGTGHTPTQWIKRKDIFEVSPDSPSGLPYFLQINYRLAVSQSQEASSLEWAIRAVCSLGFSKSGKCLCSDSTYLVRGSQKQQRRGKVSVNQSKVCARCQPVRSKRMLRDSQLG